MYACFAKEISTISHRAGIKIKRERSSTDSEQCVLPAHLQFVIKRDERKMRLARRDASARFHFPVGSRAFAANNRPATISVTNRAHNKTLLFTVSVAEHERDGATKQRGKKASSARFTERRNAHPTRVTHESVEYYIGTLREESSWNHSPPLLLEALSNFLILSAQEGIQELSLI